MDAPMPRLPNYSLEHVRRRDDVVAHAVAAVLRSEGHEVERKYRPSAGSSRTRDWIASINGVPTAIEVTRLLPPPYVRKAQNRVSHVEIGVQGFLTPAITGVGGQVLLALAYSASGVAARRRDRLVSDTRVLASEVRQTLNRLVEGSEPIAIASPIPWVARAEVTLIPGPQDGFHVVQLPDDARPDLDGFVARTIAAMANQHLGYAAQAILAIDARFPDADELRVAFGRSPVPVPWWRVYHVLGSDATLAFDMNS
jgi:hypothetical protein